VLLTVAAAVHYRHAILLMIRTADAPPPLLEPTDEGPGVRWHDDYFAVQTLDARTFAIGEPRYLQQNWNYLIVGDERAVLFDAGPGIRDIRPVAAALTDRPITFVPSHFHYDHVGNTITFDHVAVPDLPHLRERARDGRLALDAMEHLGAAEGFAPPTLRVDDWLAPGSAIDLGGRRLHVLYTPGHTTDSISLLDEAAAYLFCGDFVYPGELYAFLPNSGLGDYLQASETVLDAVSPAVRIFPAHRLAPPGAPELVIADVAALGTALAAIRAGAAAGEGFYPVRYRVNGRIDLLADPPWLARWQATYPEFR
jgi:glyoxylase-like metal-dependent hydrolase (beta-lactamase superfamily II)